MPARQRPVLIAGAGPVGCIAALALARQGVAVHLFEAEPRVNDSPRAATTHAATLEMLAELDLVDEVIRRGLIEPKFRIWDRASREIIAEFDFGVLKNDTRFPYVVQCEQHKLAHMAIERLRRLEHARLDFSSRVTALRQLDDWVEVSVEDARGTRQIDGSYLIGADGGRSTIRKALGTAFVGYTHPERFLVLTTTFSFDGEHTQCSRNYFSDPTNGARCSRSRETMAAAFGGCSFPPGRTKPTRKRWMRTRSRGGCKDFFPRVVLIL
jgi:3-(3-hydroxy-phenyl)propionate hydroxylase